MKFLYINTNETNLRIDEEKWENISQNTHRTMTGALAIVGEWLESWGFRLTDPENDIVPLDPQRGVRESVDKDLTRIGDVYVPGTRIVFEDGTGRSEKILEANEDGALVLVDF